MNRRIFRQVGAVLATASALATIVGASPLSAQTYNPNGDNLPSGSPLGQSTGQNPQAGNQTGAARVTTVAPLTVYEPVSVNRVAGTSGNPAGNTAGNTGGVDRDATATTAERAFGPRVDENGLLDIDSLRLRKPLAPGEFEIWAQQVTGRPLKRFGSDLLLPASRDFAVPATATVPPDYALNIGDTVSIALTGSVEGSVNTQIDRNGQIFLPRIGAVTLLGVRYRDLRDRISAAVGRRYRGYEVTVSVPRLRGVRVYVTGFAGQPGAYSVNSLSTLANAVLQAGGPSAGGSFRSVKLYRNGHEVADFDLYELLRKGNRALDPVLQNEDVLFIPPLGQQVAVIGSVNEEAIYELKPDESLEDVLRLAGGATDHADRARVILYRVADQDTVGSRQIARTQTAAVPAAGGDILQVLPQGTLARPLDRQQAVVRIEGEVNRPGNYFVPPNTPLDQVIAMAGGLTPRAYVYGTRFTRESVRAQQRRSFLEAVDQMELALAAAPLTSDGPVDAALRQTQLGAAQNFLAQLRRREPDGRLVIDLRPGDQTLPGTLPVENNDRIVVPPRIDTVGVFGAVYRPASFLLAPGRTRRVKDYIEEAGGRLRSADRGQIFVVRANGSVISHKRGSLTTVVIPGDVVFVPVKTSNVGLWTKLKDISTVLFQFGLSAIALSSAN